MKKKTFSTYFHTKQKARLAAILPEDNHIRSLAFGTVIISYCGITTAAPTQTRTLSFFSGYLIVPRKILYLIIWSLRERNESRIKTIKETKMRARQKNISTSGGSLMVSNGTEIWSKIHKQLYNCEASKRLKFRPNQLQ